eukprot:357241-Chlamydomonas_euryale.AAC.21
MRTKAHHSVGLWEKVPGSGQPPRLQPSPAPARGHLQGNAWLARDLFRTFSPAKYHAGCRRYSSRRHAPPPQPAEGAVRQGSQLSQARDLLQPWLRWRRSRAAPPSERRRGRCSSLPRALDASGTTRRCSRAVASQGLWPLPGSKSPLRRQFVDPRPRAGSAKGACSLAAGACNGDRRVPARLRRACAAACGTEGRATGTKAPPTGGAVPCRRGGYECGEGDRGF